MVDRFPEGSLGVALDSWDKLELVKFAVWCARKVAHLSPDPRVAEALSEAERWLEDPNDETAASLHGDQGAYSSTFSANVDHAAYCSAATVSAANFAARTCVSTDYVVTYTTRAARTAGIGLGLTSKQLLDSYLSEVLMSEVISEPIY